MWCWVMMSMHDKLAKLLAYIIGELWEYPVDIIQYEDENGPTIGLFVPDDNLVYIALGYLIRMDETDTLVGYARDWLGVPDEWFNDVCISPKIMFRVKEVGGEDFGGYIVY